MRIVMIAALLLAGCQGVQAVREAEPLDERRVQADWRDMLACFTEKQQSEGYLLQPVIREREQRATLLTLMPGLTPMPLWETTFQGEAGDRTLLQHRTTLSSIWGHPYGLASFREWAAACEAAERRSAS
jgi:hypothetical protein